MKILFIIDTLTSGGKERRLVELMKALKRVSDIEFELAIMSNDIHYQEALSLGIKIHYIIRKRKKDLSVFRKFYKICKAFQPDLVHCWDSMTAIYIIPTCKLLGIKLVNGMVVDTPVRKNIFNKFWLRAKVTFLFSDVVVGNSRAGLRAYHAPERKSICVYNGFNFDRIRKIESAAAIRNKFGIKANYVVLMVGAFGKRKDYDCYVDAAKNIINKRKDVEFVAVGDGENVAIISQKIGSSFNGRIKLLGIQSDVESIINISDICVLTTNAKVHGEGISNSILEYMALGKPVIATSGGGTNEIVEEMKTGFIINPCKPAELADRIERLLNDANLRTSMGAAGNERIHNHFSIDKMTKEYILVYNDILLNNKRRHAAILNGGNGTSGY